MHLPRLQSDAGSAVVAFLAASLGAIAITGATWILLAAGFARVMELDLVGEVARAAVMADHANPMSADELGAVIDTRLAELPIKVSLRDLVATTDSDAGLTLLTRFTVPGLELIPLSQEVVVHAGAELGE
jgi:hypothetical protein